MSPPCQERPRNPKYGADAENAETHAPRTPPHSGRRTRRQGPRWQTDGIVEISSLPQRPCAMILGRRQMTATCPRYRCSGTEIRYPDLLHEQSRHASVSTLSFPFRHTSNPTDHTCEKETGCLGHWDSHDYSEAWNGLSILEGLAGQGMADVLSNGCLRLGSYVAGIMIVNA